MSDRVDEVVQPFFRELDRRSPHVYSRLNAEIKDMLRRAVLAGLELHREECASRGCMWCRALVASGKPTEPK